MQNPLCVLTTLSFGQSSGFWSVLSWSDLPPKQLLKELFFDKILVPPPSGDSPLWLQIPHQVIHYLVTRESLYPAPATLRAHGIQGELVQDYKDLVKTFSPVPAKAGFKPVTQSESDCMYPIAIQVPSNDFF